MQLIKLENDAMRCTALLGVLFGLNFYAHGVGQPMLHSVEFVVYWHEFRKMRKRDETGKHSKACACQIAPPRTEGMRYDVVVFDGGVIETGSLKAERRS